MIVPYAYTTSHQMLRMELRASHGLIGLCVISWIITAINPYDVEAWALEQIASVLLIGTFWWSARHINYSLTTLCGLTSLFVLHSIGTHYTYSLTPYDPFLHATFGVSLNELVGWDRNQYDRFVHFFFGVVSARVFFEYLVQRISMTNATAWFLSFHLVISTSAIYELMEWAAAIVFASDAGILYLGSQGDIWDAQKDIYLGGMGFIVALALFYLQQRFKSPDSSSGYVTVEEKKRAVMSDNPR